MLTSYWKNVMKQRKGIILMTKKTTRTAPKALAAWLILLALLAGACSAPPASGPPTAPASPTSQAPKPTPDATTAPAPTVGGGPLLEFSRGGGVAGFCDQLTLTAD